MKKRMSPSLSRAASAALLLLGSLLFAGPARAQGSLEEDPGTSASTRDLRLPPPVDAFLVQGVEVQVDGRLDEAVWSQAQPLTGFVQGEPVEGAPAEHDTEVRVVFGEDAVYVAARMWDTDPGGIGTQLVRRDGEGAFDWFGFAVDPNRDRRTGYFFRVSAAGVQRDEYLYDDERADEAWDAIWPVSYTHLTLPTNREV